MNKTHTHTHTPSRPYRGGGHTGIHPSSPPLRLRCQALRGHQPSTLLSQVQDLFEGTRAGLKGEDKRCLDLFGFIYYCLRNDKNCYMYGKIGLNIIISGFNIYTHIPYVHTHPTHMYTYPHTFKTHSNTNISIHNSVQIFPILFCKLHI